MSDLTPIRPDQIAVSHRFDVCDGKGDSIAHVVVHERGLGRSGYQTCGFTPSTVAAVLRAC